MRSTSYGVRSHIDDFGTGASSLRLLHGFPGDAVKIHRALVIGMGLEAGAFEIVKALVGLAHNLGLEVIAEGVETAAQLDHLKLLGCEFAQGFHISAPLRPEDATALLHGTALGGRARRRVVGLRSVSARARSGRPRCSRASSSRPCS